MADIMDIKTFEQPPDAEIAVHFQNKRSVGDE
jgi:hypothetical protein